MFLTVPDTLINNSMQKAVNKFKAEKMEKMKKEGADIDAYYKR